MMIWVDADACPKPIKEILFRAATRKRIHLTLVANQFLRVPPSLYIKTMQVPSGFDMADNKIIQQLEMNDLVITADIPLAAAAITKGGYALNYRGEFYTQANIGERLAIRNFADKLRSSGIETGGPAAFNQANRKACADQLDRFLAKI